MEKEFSEDEMLNITHSVMPVLIKEGFVKEDDLFRWENNTGKMIYFVPKEDVGETPYIRIR